MTINDTVIGAEIEPEQFATEVRSALNDQHRLAGLFAVPEATGVRLVAAVAEDGRLSVITTTLPERTTSYPSVTALVPGADWYAEREIHDLYGIEAVGHPDLDPLRHPPPPRCIDPTASRIGRR